MSGAVTSAVVLDVVLAARSVTADVTDRPGECPVSRLQLPVKAAARREGDAGDLTVCSLQLASATTWIHSRCPTRLAVALKLKSSLGVDVAVLEPDLAD